MSSIKISVKVVPGSSQDQIVGWLGQHLKIKVKAPPANGKANTAVVKLLAETLDVPVRSIKIISGNATSQKLVEVIGIQEALFNNRLPIDDAYPHLLSSGVGTKFPKRALI